MHTQCSDGIDNDGDGLIDSADPGCHTDHNPANSVSYDPRISSEYDGLTSIPQCNDSIDNNGNGLKDSADPYCHTDLDATNDNSWDANRFENGWIGNSCTSDNDCYRLLRCMSTVKFDKIGGTLIVKKYFEKGVCKIKIEKANK
jgi:hypothetical protein